jgi:hypothetical protein
MHGWGKQTWQDGSTYEGEFVHGKKSGKGRIVFSNLDYYDGDWADDLFHGLGDYVSEDGAFYRGHFEYD